MEQVPVKAAVIAVVTANRTVRRHINDVLREDQYTIVEAITIEEAQHQLETQRPTLLLLDFALEDSDTFCQHCSHVGLAVLALTPDDDSASTAFEAGARDYVVYGGKSFSAALRSRLRHMTQQPFNPARCLLWSAIVRQIDDHYTWDLHVLDEVSAQKFLPMKLAQGQSYSEAWLNSKLASELPAMHETFRLTMQTGQHTYHQTFGCQTADDTRWLYEDVQIVPLNTGVWQLNGVCTDITEYREDAAILYEANEQLEAHVQKRTIELRNTVKHLQAEIAARAQAEIALRESESRYRVLMEQASDGISIVDKRGKILEVNARICELLGYTREEMMHLHTYDLVQPHDLAQNPIHTQEVLSGETVLTERMLLRKNGSMVYGEISARMMADGRVQCIVRDITERKLVEKDLHISQMALQHKTNSLTIINTIADTLYQSLDVQTVVEHAVKGVIEYIKASGINLYLYEPELDTLRLVAKHGISDDLLRLGDVLAVSESMTGLAVQQREIIYSENLQRDNRLQKHYRDNIKQEDFRRFYALPVIYQDQVMGVLSLLFRASDSLTAEEMETLFSVAKTLGVALANARYVTQLKAESEQRRRAEAAEREQRLVAEALRDSAAALTSTLYIHEVLERILEDITRVVPCDAANVSMVDGDFVQVVTARNYERWDYENHIRDIKLPISTTPSFQWMFTSKQPMYLTNLALDETWVRAVDDEWRQSYIGAPLMIDGHVIGFINLDSAMPSTYNDAHLGRLQAFANQASIAIRNARYYETLQQQASELEQRVMERTAEVESERAQLHAILNSMTEGVVFLDQNAQARYLNQALCELTGYNMAEWRHDTLGLGVQISGLDGDAFHALRQHASASLDRIGTWHTNIQLHRADSSVFDAAVTCNRVLEPGGREVGIVMMIRDVSQEKALEEQKSRFVARASHELRTPLSNLKTRLYLISKQPHRFDEHMSVIQQVTQRMERLVDDLLDMSRLERGVIALHRRDIVLQNLLNEVANTQRPEADLKHIDMQIEMPDEALAIAVDPDRMTQVITNLVSNAIKYTSEGGRVTLRLYTTPDKASAVISIQDSGMGISSEHLPHLFQPFFRVDENTKGTGLGLSIARDIIDLHHGRIEVESELGSGTCFRVYLALKNAKSSV